MPEVKSEVAAPDDVLVVISVIAITSPPTF